VHLKSLLEQQNLISRGSLSPAQDINENFQPLKSPVFVRKNLEDLL
jgi:hypothetical protein